MLIFFQYFPGRDIFIPGSLWHEQVQATAPQSHQTSPSVALTSELPFLLKKWPIFHQEKSPFPVGMKCQSFISPILTLLSAQQPHTLLSSPAPQKVWLAPTAHSPHQQLRGTALRRRTELKAFCVQFLFFQDGRRCQLLGNKLSKWSWKRLILHLQFQSDHCNCNFAISSECDGQYVLTDVCSPGSVFKVMLRSSLPFYALSHRWVIDCQIPWHNRNLPPAPPSNLKLPKTSRGLETYITEPKDIEFVAQKYNDRKVFSRLSLVCSTQTWCWFSSCTNHTQVLEEWHQ